MNVEFRSSFLKDIRAIRDKSIHARLPELIQLVGDAEYLGQISNLKRLKGGDNYYRSRVGDCRVGLIIEGDIVTFVRFLHRREVYRYFP